MTSILRSQKLARRAFLRGAGVTMALPWLESIRVWGDGTPNLGAAPGAFPKRIAAILWATESMGTIGGPKVPVPRWN